MKRYRNRIILKPSTLSEPFDTAKLESVQYHKRSHKKTVLLSCFLVWIFFVSDVSYAHSTDKTVDTIIFSYNRPMQLYALLESMYKHIRSGLGQVHVLYRVDNDAYAAAYELVHQTFCEVHFTQQGKDPKRDFKPLLLDSFKSSRSAYIMFAVDDIILKDSFDLCDVITALEGVPQAYGFYLRLGSNIKNSYAAQTIGYVPRLHKITDTIVAWSICGAPADWGYPHTVDMTIYRKKDIQDYLHHLSYTGPNTFEGHWSSGAVPKNTPLGLCYITSKIVNIPYNRVQDVFPNVYMHEKTTDELLHLFVAGKKIAIDDLWHIDNTAPHMEYSLRFIDRT